MPHAKDKPYQPLAFTQVRIQDQFWTPKIKVNREVTIPLEYQQCKDTGRLDAWKQDWTPGVVPIPHIFWDSDVAKWIEAASYSLSDHPDAELDAQLDEVIAAIAAAQQPDGYLNTHFTAVEPEKRWCDLHHEHELYCAGHLMEAAVAHYQATGKRSLLDVLCRYADHIGQVFGTGYDQLRGYCGHEEIELALVKMYRVTGEERFLQLSRYFIEERGQLPFYFDLEAMARGEKLADSRPNRYEYMQAHLPVREQTKVVGHAVRAMYLYCAMADLSLELGDESLFAACETLWSHLHTKHLYITGGIGAQASNEGFTTDYDLPNETAYCETCAAIGLVFWNHRMLQQKCDSRYADTIERVLYNAALSGISLDGTRFFYGNPLAAYANLIPHGNAGNSPDYYRRSEWFDCACCPPNLARLVASLGEYIYSIKAEDELAVHLYIQGDARLQLSGQQVRISQETRYPWDGDIHLQVFMDEAAAFTLKLRIPGWCRGYELAVNGERVDNAGVLELGYVKLARVWHPADEVRLTLHMPIERVYAHPEIKANVGCTALQRGPLVYCLEQADHEVPVRRMLLPAGADLTAVFEPGLLDGVVVLRGAALVADLQGWEETLYRTEKPLHSNVALTAVPYYAWANREPGEMKVWIPESQN